MITVSDNFVTIKEEDQNGSYVSTTFPKHQVRGFKYISSSSILKVDYSSDEGALSISLTATADEHNSLLEAMG